jgi:hypothetical protein
MNPNPTTTRRRRVRDLAGLGTLAAAVMLALSIVAVVGGSDNAAHALASSGAATIGLSGGGDTTDVASSTAFTISLPSGSVCPGTGADGYHYQSFMVSSSVDASALTYSGTGPKVPAGSPAGTIVYSVYATTSTPVNGFPANSPAGLISNIPNMNFAVFTPGNIPAGTYKLGIACTLEGNTVKFWQGEIDVITSADDKPAGITWSGHTETVDTLAPDSVADSVAPDSVAPDSVAPDSVAPDSVPESVPSVTDAPTTTTTTVADDGSTTTTILASQSPTPTDPPTVGTLANTGASLTPIFLWGLLFLVLGRITILLARPVRLRPARRR